MTTYKRLRDASQAQEFERRQWAQETQLVYRLNIEGRGELTLDPIKFGLAFQGAPFFWWGVELEVDNTLVEGDFPFVGCGVASWEKSTVSNEVVEPRYLGANLYVNISSVSEYKMVLTAVFEGVAYQNPAFTVEQ